MNLCIRLIPSDIHSLRILRTSKFCHHIFWKVYDYRSRSSCPGDVERFLDDPAQIFSVSHRHAVFCDAPRDAHDIDFLKGVVTDQMSRHLPCKADKRDAVIICCREACHKIGRPGSAGNQAYAYFSCRPCIGVRLMDQSLFMPRKDDPDIILFVQLVADIDRTRSGITKDCVHPFFL